MRKIFTTLVVFTAITFNAQTLSLDTSFGVNGIASVPLAGEGNDLQIFISKDNKILAFGKDLSTSTSINPNKIYKFNFDGTLDTTFGSSGTLILPDYVGDFDVIPQGTDKFLVSFQKVSSALEKSILRYDLNGVLDSTFGTNGEVKITRDTGTFGFSLRFRNLAVLPDNSLVLADGERYLSFTENGVLTNSITQVNSADIQSVGADILEYGASTIKKLTTTGTTVNAFGNSGTFTYPASGDYYSKQTSAGNINSLNFNDNTFYNISANGSLVNNFVLTNDKSSIDYYSNYFFDGSRYFFVGTATSMQPFIVSYSVDGNIIKLNNLDSYKESALPIGNYTSVFVKDNALYVGGDFVESATNKWYYVVAKYNFSTLSTSENDLKNKITFENPINNNLNFRTSEKISIIEIHSTDGRLVKTVKESNTNVSELLKGLYIAKVIFQNGKTETKKLIKN